MSAGIPLPPADITRWTRHRKAEVVEAGAQGAHSSCRCDAALGDKRG